MTPEHHDIDDDVKLWLDPDGGITLKAVTKEGDPVELSASQAHLLAKALEELAEADDA
jgi:hypothetical protein